MNSKDIKTVLVMGAGTMGHGVAQVMASAGKETYLVDTSEAQLAKAMGWIKDNLALMAELDRIEPGRIKSILDRVHPVVDYEGPAGSADYIFEAVFEDFDLKAGLHKKLSCLARPEAILATNTSSYDITDLSGNVTGAERFIGTHWFHPSHITPCVEVIPGKETSRSIIKQTLALLEGIGKFPTICRSAPGFVANRIQMALALEAMSIVQEGLASPEEVDRIVKSSFGFRLSAYGPFEICDQAGNDTYLAVLEYLSEKMGRKQFDPPELLRELVSEGRLGIKSLKGFYQYQPGVEAKVKAERDRRLFGRLNLFNQENNLRPGADRTKEEAGSGKQGRSAGVVP